MQYNDFPQISQNRAICKDLNLVAELNDPIMLEKIYNDACKEIGLELSQRIASDLFIRKVGEVIFRYAQNGKIDPNKALTVINNPYGIDPNVILGCTAISLMEDYGIIKGGPKMP